VKRRGTFGVVLVGSAVLIVTAFHLGTALESVVLHELYQRLYYVPIIAAALMFGLRGGLAAAAFATLAYLPHIVIHWHHADFNYAVNQYTELALFFFVGALVGALGDRSRVARERAERSAAELQRAYGELRTTFEQLVLADRLTSLGELAASVMHEVRNPLASIKGAVEIMEHDIPATSPRHEFALIARAEIDRLDRLVDGFLKFARPAKPVVAPTDINRLVGSVATLIERRAASRNVTIEVVSDLSHSNVTVDAEQITQVLLNLILNALDSMPAGGVVRIRTSFDPQGALSIEVTDEGAGIDPALVGRVFDPFVTTKEKGLGLGLSIAHRIVTEHGGSLVVRNGESGAVFCMTIPAGERVEHSTQFQGG